MDKRIRRIAALALLLAVTHLAMADNYVVTTTADSGEGSLRAALNGVSMSYMGTSTISFNIPTSDAGYNATTGKIQFKSEAPISTPMMLYSADGRLLQHIDGPDGTLDLSAYSKGLYILRAEGRSFRIVKQ